MLRISWDCIEFCKWCREEANLLIDEYCDVYDNWQDIYNAVITSLETDYPGRKIYFNKYEED